MIRKRTVKAKLAMVHQADLVHCNKVHILQQICSTQFYNITLGLGKTTTRQDRFLAIHEMLITSHDAASSSSTSEGCCSCGFCFTNDSSSSVARRFLDSVLSSSFSSVDHCSSGSVISGSPGSVSSRSLGTVVRCFSASVISGFLGPCFSGQLLL